MVVLDGHNMLGAGPHQYLPPDYLSPLPTTLDAKKSPLALLAQTCSQIGADSPSTKSLLPTLHESVKRKSSSSSESSSLKSEADVRDSNSRPRSSGSNSGGTSHHNGKSSSHGKSSPAFKPYENSSSTPSFAEQGGRSSKKSNSRESPHDSSEKCRTPKNFSTSGSCSPAKISRSSPPVSSTSFSAASISATATTTASPASSTISSANATANVNVNTESKSGLANGSNSSSTSTSSLSPPENGKNSPHPSSHSKTSPPIDQGASPIIRSGLEVLHGHLGKDYGKSGAALSSLSALAGYPPGFDPTNPALRPSFFAPPHHALSGGHFMGYPPATGSPYVGYTRVKTPSGAETIVPVCKDPYCTGCQFGNGAANAAAAAAAASGMNGLMAAAAAAGFPSLSAAAQSGGICPAGCVQCDHQKFSFAGFQPSFGMGHPHGLSAAAVALGYPQSLLSQHAAAAHAAAAQQQQQQQQQQAQHHAQRPYVCNWIVGDTYCGKRYPSSEELLVHLRTHTNLSGGAGGSDAAAVVAAAQQQQLAQLSNSSLYSSALLSSSAAAAAAAAMHRTYPTPPLSPLSAARYHPYASAVAAAAKVPTSLSSLVPSNLANYYTSPYSIYGQRIGPPVHQ